MDDPAKNVRKVLRNILVSHALAGNGEEPTNADIIAVFVAAQVDMDQALQGGEPMPNHYSREQEAQRRAQQLPGAPVMTPEQRAERARKLQAHAPWRKQKDS